jgi:hypothetical protein
VDIKLQTFIDLDIRIRPGEIRSGSYRMSGEVSNSNVLEGVVDKKALPQYISPIRNSVFLTRTSALSSSIPFLGVPNIGSNSLLFFF